MVTPPAEELACIAEERERQLDIRSRFRDVTRCPGRLAPAGRGCLSSRFGLRRIFNGEPRAPPPASTWRCPPAPHPRPADGVVTLVDDLYFNGKTVFVDHGQGFVSDGRHLSGWR